MNFNHDLGSIDTILSVDTSQTPPLSGTTNTLTITGTGAIRVPVGNTAARPVNKPRFTPSRSHRLTRDGDDK